MTPPKSSQQDDHVLLVDSRSARLITFSRTGHGRLHAEQVAQIEEDWDETQHGRPSPLASGQSHSGAGFGHENEERTHRWAKRVTHWIEAELKLAAGIRVDLFAAARLFGELRGQLSRKHPFDLQTHELDIAHLSNSELTKHRAIIRIVEEREADRAGA